ncbi:Nucleotide-binding universal stress protein, UspA family [Desulfotomaculum arcticum]|uniref:Universal stress protein n=1 Tax=Desulfotruncus arcticus DSM 17038 TaxID=1121424 RepID=A0A1I2YWB3_9FIRM|nr:Nucleotide-binding universal stress protein, UspA family [Desulfotomaculum arcticum] [Desulfotruncus arcticus DSM 17038]
MYKKILVAVDGSDISQKAIKQAAELALKFEATITLFHVVAPLPSTIRTSIYEQQLIDGIIEEGNHTLDEAKNDLISFNVQVDTDMIVGDPSTEIITKAKKGQYDLVVIGNRGLGALSGFIMGSVSRRVVRHASCPVLIVR